MSANKHYGRQIVLSLFLTVFGILGLLYLASRFLLPHIDVNQQQVYDVLVRLFPLLLGLIMIEVGVLVARRRDEEIEDDADRLPPNAYDRPFYTLPADDPIHLHAEDLSLAQNVVDQQITMPPSPQVSPPPTVAEPVAPIAPVMESVATSEIGAVEEEVTTDLPEILVTESRFTESSPLEEIVVEEKAKEVPTEIPVLEPIVSPPMMVVPATPTFESTTAPTETFDVADFDALLAVELDNALQMEYDITLVIIDVEEGPATQIANKLVMLSVDLAYSFVRDDNTIALILPFYNNDEARIFTLSLIESCEKEFAEAVLKIGLASRDGRFIDADQLIHEAEAASLIAD